MKNEKSYTEKKKTKEIIDQSSFCKETKRLRSMRCITIPQSKTAIENYTSNTEEGRAEMDADPSTVLGYFTNGLDHQLVIAREAKKTRTYVEIFFWAWIIGIVLYVIANVI